MKHNLGFETGETTCAIEPGRFCVFCNVKGVTIASYCNYFNQYIHKKDGWLQRTESGIAIDPAEWSAIREAIDKMVGECRGDDEEKEESNERNK